MNSRSPSTYGLLQVIFAGPGFKHAVNLTPGPTFLQGGHYYGFIADIPYYTESITEAQMRYDRSSSGSAQSIYLNRVYITETSGRAGRGFCGNSPQVLTGGFWYRLARAC